MKRLVWLPIAGFLLIAGAAVAVAAPTVADNAVALLDDLSEGNITAASSPSPADGSGSEPLKGPGFDFGLRVEGERDSLLDEVLADLVSAGTITQAQADAITQGLTDKVEARRAEIEAERQKMEEMWTQIRGFLEDDVITSDEIAQLPEDNPFTNLQNILSDGQITLEELQSVGPFGGFFVDGPGRLGPGAPGHRHGWFLGPNDDSSPDTGSGSDSDSDADSNSNSSNS